MTNVFNGWICCVKSSDMPSVLVEMGFLSNRETRQTSIGNPTGANWLGADRGDSEVS